MADTPVIRVPDVSGNLLPNGTDTQTLKNVAGDWVATSDLVVDAAGQIGVNSFLPANQNVLTHNILFNDNTTGIWAYNNNAANIQIGFMGNLVDVGNGGFEYAHTGVGATLYRNICLSNNNYHDFSVYPVGTAGDIIPTSDMFVRIQSEGMGIHTVTDLASKLTIFADPADSLISFQAVEGFSRLALKAVNTDPEFAFVDRNSDPLYTIRENTSSQHHAWSTGGVERMRITHAGEVGIGIASPTNRKLWVRQDAGAGNFKAGIQVEATDPAWNDSAGLVRIDVNGTSGDGALLICIDSNNLTTGRLDGDGTFAWGHNGSVTTLTGTSAGLVGLGTTTPENALHVKGVNDAEGTILQLDNTGGIPNAGNNILFKYDDAGSTVDGNEDSLGGLVVKASYTTGSLFSGIAAKLRCATPSAWSVSSNPTYWAFHTTPANSTTMSERMRIDATGNVGIGTTAPNSVLEVIGQAGFCASFAGSGAQGGIGISGTGTNSWFSTAILAQDNDLFFTTQGTERLRIAANGNISISTGVEYGAKLTFNNAIDTTASDVNKIHLYNNGAGAIFGFGVAAGALTYRTSGNHIFYDGATERMRLDSEGELGIGTTGPTAKLHVRGVNSTHNYYANGDPVGSTLLLEDTSNTSGTGGMILFSSGFGGGGASGSCAAIRGRITNGTGPAGHLSFMTRSTSGNVVERMRINDTGGVWITNHLQINSPSVATSEAVPLVINGTVACQALSPASQFTASWLNGILGYISSDLTLKKNIVPFAGATAILKTVDVIEFDWNDLSQQEDNHDIGFSWQNLNSVYPIAAPENTSGDKGLNMPALLALAVQTIKELEARITALEP